MKFKQKKVVRQFGDGINTFLPPMSIGESEITDSLNMCADDYPDIRTRNDRVVEPIGTTTPNALGQRENRSMHVLDGVAWKHKLPGSTAWTQLSTSMLNQEAGFVEFNTQAFRFTILANNSTGGQITYAYDGTTTLVSMTTNAPHSNMYTAHRYRVFGVDDNKRTVKHSAQGSITDWVTSLDAGAFDVTNAKGDITAITTFNDHVIIFSDNSYHEVYGTEPLNYNLIDGSYEIGCVGRKAFVECKGKFYWMHYNGIYLYTGGTPRLISEKVNKWIKGINWTYKNLICAGSKDNKIYFSIPYGSTSLNRILVYDTFKDKWFVEDGSFKTFTNINGVLYGQSAAGSIWNMNSTQMTGNDNSTAISWSFQTKAYNDFELDMESAVKDMWTLYSGSTNATMDINYSTDVYSTTFNALSTGLTFTGEPYKEQTVLPLAKLQGVGQYRLEFEGTGHARIHGNQLNVVSYGG